MNIELPIVAAAQTVPRRGDIGFNVDEHVRLANIAAKYEAQMLVFPELSLTGYELDLASTLNFSEYDRRLQPLLEVSAATGMILVVGAPIELDDRLFIASFILSPTGDIAIYTKHHLGTFPSTAARYGSIPPPEPSVFSAGHRNPLVLIGGFPAAFAICADIGQPSHGHTAAARGARFYAASVFSIPSDVDADIDLLRSLATRTSMTAVLANFGGPSGGLAAGGNSAIIGANGEILAALPSSGAGIVVARDASDGYLAQAVESD